MKQEFIPKFFSCLREGYSFQDFIADLFAGITVGIIALPLAMAFGIASGVSPERGLATAIIAGFLISFLGGSRVQIGGPTGAFVIIIYGIVEKHGYSGLAVATLMASLMLIGLGLARLGTMIKYIPYPVTTGFTSGIALIIFSTQIKDFFGLNMAAVPAEFFSKWAEYFKAASSWNSWATFIGLGSLALLVILRRRDPRIPAALIVVILSAVLVQLFHLPVETIGSKFGDIPRALPVPAFPEIHWAMVRTLVPEAFTIALLAAIESLLSAVVADGMTGRKHRSNCELIAQGIANFGSVLFGGIPATGAIARTATNVKAGARTPVAGMIHAIVLLGLMLAFAPYAKLIPLSALAAILFLVSWNMCEFDHFRYLLKAPRGDVLVLLSTFGLTILVDLTVAVETGIVLAALLFMKRMSEVGEAVSSPKVFSAEEDEEDTPQELDGTATGAQKIPEGVQVYEINGPFFFGMADRFKDTMNRVQSPPKVYILRLRKVPVIDATAIHALREFYFKCNRQSTALILTEVQGHVLHALMRMGMVQMVGPENICESLDAGLERASALSQKGQGLH